MFPAFKIAALNPSKLRFPSLLISFSLNRSASWFGMYSIILLNLSTAWLLNLASIKASLRSSSNFGLKMIPPAESWLVTLWASKSEAWPWEWRIFLSSSVVSYPVLPATLVTSVLIMSYEDLRMQLTRVPRASFLWKSATLVMVLSGESLYLKLCYYCWNLA